MRPRMEYGKRRDEYIGCAVNMEEKQRIVDAAAKADMSVSDWLRRTLLKAAAEMLEAHEAAA